MDKHFYSPLAVYGRELTFYRKRAGLPQLEVANAAYVSDKTVSAIERGRSPATEKVAENLDRVVKANGALIRLLDLRKSDGALYPAWFNDWVLVEESASVMRAFEIDLITACSRRRPMSVSSSRAMRRPVKLACAARTS